MSPRIISEDTRQIILWAIALIVMIAALALMHPITGLIASLFLNNPCEAYANWRVNDIPARCYVYFGIK